MLPAESKMVWRSGVFEPVILAKETKRKRRKVLVIFDNECSTQMKYYR
jgi:hypothetical protein